MKFEKEASIHEKIAQSQEALIKASEDLARRGYNLVILVDRDGVVIQDPIAFARYRYPDRDFSELMPSQVPSLVLKKNLKLLSLLHFCHKAGIKICPASRDDWLNTSSTNLGELLTELKFRWQEFMDREFPNHPLVERVSADKIKLENIGDNPFFIFISDDFSPNDLGRDQPLQGFIQLLQRELPDFNPNNFKVLKVRSFGSDVLENDGLLWTDEDLLSLQDRINLAL